MLYTAIPSLGLSPLLKDVVMAARFGSDAVRIYDNTPATQESRVHKIEGAEHVEMPNTTLYGMWNAAADWAARAEADYLALLNDDLELDAEVLFRLVRALDKTPSVALVSVDWDNTPVPDPYLVRAEGTFRAGGIAGWAFVVRVDRWPEVDDGYRVWFGDDDLVEKLIRAGWEVARYRGLYVPHRTSTTIHQLPWTQAAIIEDEIRWSRRT